MHLNEHSFGWLCGWARTLRANDEAEDDFDDQARNLDSGPQAAWWIFLTPHPLIGVGIRQATR